MERLFGANRLKGGAQKCRMDAGGGKATAAQLDVRDYSAVEHVIQETVSRTGRLDYMFNNAGIAIGGPSSLHSMDDWKRIVDVNLIGVINGVHAAYRVRRVFLP